MNDAGSHNAPPQKKKKNVQATLLLSACWMTQYNGHVQLLLFFKSTYVSFDYAVQQIKLQKESMRAGIQAMGGSED